MTRNRRCTSLFYQAEEAEVFGINLTEEVTRTIVRLGHREICALFHGKRLVYV